VQTLTLGYPFVDSLREDVKVCVRPLAERDSYITRQPRETEDRAADSDEDVPAGAGSAPTTQAHSQPHAPVNADDAVGSAVLTRDERAYFERPTSMDNTPFIDFLRAWKAAPRERGTAERITCGGMHYMKRGREGTVIPW